MELIMPGLGVIFWMTLAFAIVVYILRRYAWKPILNTIKDREDNIRRSLKRSEKIEKEIKELKETKERIVSETNHEKVNIIEQAKKARDEILKEAREKAIEESKKIIEESKKIIEVERKKAEAQIKKEIAVLSIDMAEKILVSELSDKQRHKQLVLDSLEKISLN